MVNNMKKYDNLELRIMSCLLIKPDLMKELIIQDKHFTKYQRLWKFLKAFYGRYNTFDLTLMVSVCNDKYQILNYIEWLLELEVTTNNFEMYQKQLIDLYNESEKDKLIIEKVFELANRLYVRDITTGRFKELIDKLYNTDI